MTSSHGSLPLQPLVLTEDEAEALMQGLEDVIAAAKHSHYVKNTARSREYLEFVEKLYDKIKDAPR